MDVESKHKQTATWWSTSPDGYGGDKFASPILIKCRWEEVQQLFNSVLDRQEHISNAVVFVNIDIAVGDYLFLGESIDTTPEDLEGCFKIQRFDKIPDLRNLNVLRRVVL